MILENKINVEALDRIYLTDSHVAMIQKVNEKYFTKNVKNDRVEEAKEIELPFMEKGILHYKMAIKPLSQTELITYYQIRDDNTIVLSEIEASGKILYTLVVDDKMKIKKLEAYTPMYKTEMARMAIEKSFGATILLILDFIRYSQLMIHLKSENKVNIKRAVVHNPKGKTRHELKREARELARRKVSVSQEQRSYDYSESVREGDKRSYERHIESWETRGHWRTMKKSGKRVWINSFTKGQGTKKGKDYTV